jgi:hypothetical protein
MMAKKLIQLLKLDKAFKDQSGSMTFFIAIMFTTMIGVAGIAIDIARFEARRTEIQANLDNCTLTAASLRKTASPRDVVIDCMDTAQMQASYTVAATNEAFSVTHRKVTATGQLNLDTYFMKMFGVDDLDLVVSSVAEERVPHVEVSLVLDISGSMDGARLDSLIPAAKEFVDILLDGNDVTDPNRVSISLIPYNMQVNGGEELFTGLYGGSDHDYSYCAEWEASAYDEFGNDINGFSDLSFAKDYKYIQRNGNGDPVDENGNVIDLEDGGNAVELDENGNPVEVDADGNLVVGADKNFVVLSVDRLNQAVHMGYTNKNYYTYGYLNKPYCRDEEAGQILPFSFDRVALKGQIEDLTARGNTSIDIGVKWGALLLDPSSRDVISDLTTSTGRQAVDSGFDGRPVDYNDEITMKVLVVMTDGENTTEYRVKPTKRGTGNSGIWHNSDTNAYSFSSKTGTNWSQLGWTEMWGKMPLHTYNNYKGGSWSSYWSSNYNNDLKNENLQKICQASRDAGIVIFSIAYSATFDGKDALRKCAGNDAFYKEASTNSISDVFAEIGGVIEKLKLVQ